MVPVCEYDAYLYKQAGVLAQPWQANTAETKT